eukprot:gene1429-12048_t
MLKANKNLVKKLYKRNVYGSAVPPLPENEPNVTYPPLSSERVKVLEECERFRKNVQEIPIVIDGKEYKTDDFDIQGMPSDKNTIITKTHMANEKLVLKAIESSMAAKEKWAKLPLEDRQAVFIKVADLLSSKYKHTITAATMVGQGKTLWQADIDAAAESIDFLRFNSYYASKLYEKQPMKNSKYIWNKLEYRPLEGFVAAITPFNFTAIGVNLAAAPALMGNTVIMKPSQTGILAGYEAFKIFREAGVPDGVINYVPCLPKTFAPALEHKDLAGVHFTGSTGAFKHIWKTIATNLDNYKTYPRLVGETGGKNFHLVHNSANMTSVVNNLLRSAFEYSGQKCSACSRAYIPSSKWGEIKSQLVTELPKLKVGQPDDTNSFLSSVIDSKAFQRITAYIERAKASESCEVLGGHFDDSVGQFIHPTIIVTKDPKYETMEQELFGPVLTIYVYEDSEFENVLDLLDSTSVYGLTGSIFANDRNIIRHASERLRDCAGNLYINDKSTGAVVGQQPFGGARLSGTNDKSGAEFILSRWTSMRTIKENFEDLEHWGYPSVDSSKK